MTRKKGNRKECTVKVNPGKDGPEKNDIRKGDVTGIDDLKQGSLQPDTDENGTFSILQDQLSELREKMDSVTKPYEEMARKIDMLNDYAQRYLHLLGIIASHGTVSPALAVPDVKDSMGKDIVTILAEKSHMNISQLTDEMRIKRGSASRRIVRERLQGLIAMGHVTVIDGKIREYSLAEDVVRKWSQMLTGLK